MILLLPPFILLSINPPPPPHLSLTLLLPPRCRTYIGSIQNSWFKSDVMMLCYFITRNRYCYTCSTSTLSYQVILGLLLTQSCSVNHDDHYERFLGPLAICLSPFSVFTSIPHYRLKLTYTILTNSISYVLSPTFISTLTALGLGRLPCLAL